MAPLTRRHLLQLLVGIASAPVAGCSGDGSSDPIPGDRYPRIDDWLSGRAGAGSNTYYGQLADRTGQDTVTIRVGSRGNGGYIAYDPTGVVVSAGTTIEWVWTGESGPHNVVAETDTDVGPADYAFDSGEPTRGSDVSFRYTMTEPGIALYACEVHRFVGMKGGIAVTD